MPVEMLEAVVLKLNAAVVVVAQLKMAVDAVSDSSVAGQKQIAAEWQDQRLSSVA